MTRSAVQIAVPALLITGIAVPAQAAGAAEATVGATVAASASAGTTWSQVMRRKLDLETEAARLTVQLPGLRAAAVLLGSQLTTARRAEAVAVNAVTVATTADQTARARHATAKITAATAKKAVAAAKKQASRGKNRTAEATKALAAAETAVRARAAAARQTAVTVKTARSAHAAATGQMTTATTAHLSAAGAVRTAETKIAALPTKRSALATQATALSRQVVTQTRAGFTMSQTTQVYGVTVNKIVAFSFQRMIDDAALAGIPLSGGGFRTPDQQIALRKSNGCPDVWTAPSSSCRVPTAIPGRSLHELGLAVDVTSGKKSINSRSSAAFKWMAANAGRYGFVNLPSEPWHWSITGG